MWIQTLLGLRRDRSPVTFLGMPPCCEISGNHYHPLSCKLYHSWIYHVFLVLCFSRKLYHLQLFWNRYLFFSDYRGNFCVLSRKMSIPTSLSAARHLTWADLFLLSNLNQDQKILFRKIPNCFLFHYLELSVSWRLLWNPQYITNINQFCIKGIIWSNCVGACEVSCSVLKQLCPI